MDSGIDSTESSNASSQDINMEVPVQDVPANSAKLTEPCVSKENVEVEDNEERVIEQDLLHHSRTMVVIPPEPPSTTVAPYVQKDHSYNFLNGGQVKLQFPLRTTDFLQNEPLGGFEVFMSPASSDNSFALLPFEYERRELRRKFRHYKVKLKELIQPLKERKLRKAAGLYDTDAIKELLLQSINPNACDERGRTALHIAASKGYTDIVRLLLEHRANPNQKDLNGNTPLHLAACTSHIETVTLLLKGGTDVNLLDNHGSTPLHLAKRRLQLLQRDRNSSSDTLRQQLTGIVEMMKTYLNCSGNSEEAELLMAFNNQLSVGDTREKVEKDVQGLLESLQKMNIKADNL